VRFLASMQPPTVQLGDSSRVCRIGLITALAKLWIDISSQHLVQSIENPNIVINYPFELVGRVLLMLGIS